MSNELINQAFIDCAFYGYFGGFKAILDSGKQFTHAVWAEALKNAATGENRQLLHFIMAQFVAQKSELVMDADWLKELTSKNPSVAAEVDQCDRYVRSIKLREKLKGMGVNAPEVALPSFVGATPERVYAFLPDHLPSSGASKASSDGLIYAGDNGFRARVQSASQSEAAVISGFLKDAKGGR